MNQKRLFKLDNRLIACTKFIKRNSKIADIGSDHAYLPIWLIKNNIIDYAIASDVREGPLLNAKKNIEKYHLSQKIETRLSDGLQNIKSSEADTIVIAGMGGEIISKIIKDANWLKNTNKNIILQPMSQDEYLRNFLLTENFQIIDEIIASSHEKIYSVMNVKFSKDKIYVDTLYPYIGKIKPTHTNEFNVYINQKIGKLKNKILGLKNQKNISKYEELFNIIKKLENCLENKMEGETEL